MVDDYTRNEVQVDLDKYNALLDRIDELEDQLGAEPAPEEPAAPPHPYQKWLDLSSMIDSWRIFPRIFITTYIYLLIKVQCGSWHFQNLPWNRQVLFQ